jgi:ATP-dependent Clp protease ATP-binding subunit ClpA
MFERFTERARQVVVLAQDEARALKHNYIGTEHLLLGLLREEEGLAARVLESLDVTATEVRAQVARIIGSGDEAAIGQIPFTPRAKKVLELAAREARSATATSAPSISYLVSYARAKVSPTKSWRVPARTGRPSEARSRACSTRRSDDARGDPGRKGRGCGSWAGTRREWACSRGCSGPASACWPAG